MYVCYGSWYNREKLERLNWEFSHNLLTVVDYYGKEDIDNLRAPFVYDVRMLPIAIDIISLSNGLLLTGFKDVARDNR